MKRTLRLLAVSLSISAIGAVAADAASSPAVATGSASSVTTTTAVLHASVNPDGSSTGYRFEWGLTIGYGITGAVKAAGSGTKPVAVTYKITGLIPGTVYHYRVVALNKFGGSNGLDRKFTTAGNPPPLTATGPAQVTSASTATLTGVINPHGQKTSYSFQYGPTASYGSESFSQSVPAGTTPVNVSTLLSGLSSNTNFHYRIVAVHSGSVRQYGADQTFWTFPSPRPVPRVPARTTPGRDRNKPFVFTTSGKLIGPTGATAAPKSLSCFQNATVRFMLGRRLVGFGVADVLPDCSFKTQTVFNRLPGRGKKHRQVHLRVLIHFRGNGYLAPADAKPEKITLG